MTIALLIRPLVALVVLGLICLPIRLAVQRYMRDGELKRLLLAPIGEPRSDR